MIKFLIYRKDKKFHLTDGKIIWTQFILAFAPIVIRVLIIKNSNQSVFEIYILWILIISFIISFLLNISSFLRFAPLEGKIEGELILSEKEIIIDEIKLNIEEIKNIKITNDDFYDSLARYSKGVIIGRRSNGVNNEIKILLKNGKEYVINFQQDDNHNMQDSKELLQYYYSKRIMKMENLLYVLGIVEEKEKNEFKATL